MYYPLVRFLQGAEREMNKLIAVLILSLSSVATVAYAEHGGDRGDYGDHKGHSFAAPEIDPSSVIGALTLLLGSVVVLRSRVATKQ
jgi:hypothetical protein